MAIEITEYEYVLKGIRKETQSTEQQQDMLKSTEAKWS
jgi:hypothetical protein